MKHLEIMRIEEQLAPGAELGGGKVEFAGLLGTWWNTDKGTGGLVRMELLQRGEELVLRAFGAASPQPRDWGEVVAQAYSAAVGSPTGMALSARYDFGFLEVLLAAYTKSGILVLDTFNTFKDGSGRAPYFSREFFHR
jgi:hypothetical protein